MTRLALSCARSHLLPSACISLPGSCVSSHATGGCRRASAKSRHRQTPSPENAMQLTPLIAVHMSAAIGALATGPVALWARRGRAQRPRLHRAFGYAWVTLMIITAVSALFIRDWKLPNMAGYTPVHLLVPAPFIRPFR